MQMYLHNAVITSKTKVYVQLVFVLVLSVLMIVFFGTLMNLISITVFSRSAIMVKINALLIVAN